MPVMPFCAVKLRVSPTIKPPIVTVASVILSPLSVSTNPSVPSSVTGVAAAASEGRGATGLHGRCHMHRVEGAGAGRGAIAVVAVIDGPADGPRGVAPAAVGSPPAEAVGHGVKCGLILRDSGVALQRQHAVAVDAGDALCVGEVQRVAGGQVRCNRHGCADERAVAVSVAHGQVVSSVTGGAFRR